MPFHGSRGKKIRERAGWGTSLFEVDGVEVSALSAKSHESVGGRALGAAKALFLIAKLAPAIVFVISFQNCRYT